MTTPQTIDEIVKEFENSLIGENGWLIDHPEERSDEIMSEFRTALASAIQGEHDRIIKLLPKESEIPSYDQASVSYTAGWNDYRREALQILTPKE